ncbi:putative Chromatin remodelling complex Rsc7/Swp82 subunit-domain-containing protein [Seiridium unicorne]|uniref:Chromatin remodelling complex Rsc7/Swp82 subunit-domain-containing protein n=1 Tax=Seiridium unicorne TaxID=138068 RepID=A0ABR2UT70_9PEZI
MYHSTQPNGAEGATINPATINPAALNSASRLRGPKWDPRLYALRLAGAAHKLLNANARGLKRSRSPEYQEVQSSGTPGDDASVCTGPNINRATGHALISTRDTGDNPRKRGRPTMKPRPSGGMMDQSRQSPHMGSNMPTMAQPPTLPPHTPQTQNVPLPAQGAYTPAQAPQTSPPPKTTPTKTTLKALPTVRDHTTDQLGPGGDEYLPRETDEAGEKKVMGNGQLTGNREYRCRTFLVPNRGDKLFMLATECARVLGYRDSYLLFNKNRSLFKIIANQVEKDDLVAQEILPFSYRSRQIAIVTARSMFRQFGSRVIVNGRRVRDDYWEGKARKQGFTEADLAGEKRPGASKAREEAAAAAAANNPPPLVGGPHGEIVYANTPGQFGAPPQPQLVQPGMIGAPPGNSLRMPMITAPSTDLNDRRPDYNFIKGGPRQEITGPAYQDRTQPSPLSEIHAQAHHAAEFNRSINSGREVRNDYMQNMWRRPHEQPSAPAVGGDSSLPTTRAGQSPHAAPANIQQPSLVPNQSPQMMMTAPPYSQSIHSQQPISQAPMRGMPQAPSQKQNRPPSLSGPAGSLAPGAQTYNYGQNPMWNHPQTPQTPQHYPGYTTQPQQSPHPQQSPAPQLRHPSGTQQMQQGAMQYPGMPGMSSYGNPGQMYPPEQTPRQFMPQNPAGSPAVTQGWSNQQTPAAGNWWANQPQ